MCKIHSPHKHNSLANSVITQYHHKTHYNKIYRAGSTSIYHATYICSFQREEQSDAWSSAPTITNGALINACLAKITEGMEGERERVKEGKREGKRREPGRKEGRKDSKRKTNRCFTWMEPSVR